MKLFYIILSFLFLGACVIAPSTNVDLTSKDNNQTIEEDRNRDSVIERTKSLFQGKNCKDLGKEAECHKQCDNIYNQFKAREGCKSKLTNRQVEEIYKVWNVLKNSNSDTLVDINPDAFNLFLSISISTLDRFIELYDHRKAKQFLFWLINKPSNAYFFIAEDKNHNTLDELLNNLQSFDSDTVYEPFLENIDKRTNLMELAIASGDEDIMKWFIDFINEKNKDCKDNTETIKCFRIYCIISEGISKNNRYKWLSFEVFEDYLKGIIDEKVNSQQGEDNETHNNLGWEHEDAPGDSKAQISDVEDLMADDWDEQLCQGLNLNNPP